MVRVNSKPGIPCWCCPSGGSAHHSAKATKQNWMINSLLDSKHPPQPGLKCLIVHFTSDQYPGIRAYVFTETLLLFGAALYCQLRLTAEAWHSDTEKRQWVRRWAALISKGDRLLSWKTYWITLTLRCQLCKRSSCNIFTATYHASDIHNI